MSHDINDDKKVDNAQLSSQIRGEKSSIFDLARGRISFLATFFIILYLIIAARVVDLSVVQGTLLQIKESHASVVLKKETEAPLRADILDRNGMLLASSLKTQSLGVNSTIIQNPQEVLDGLNKIIPDLPQEKILKRLSANRQFDWISRDLTPAQQKAVFMMGEPALTFRDETRRIYPQEKLASHLVGYTDIDGVGLSGLERSFHEELMQANEPLKTTIDVRLQHAMTKELKSIMTEFKANSATGLIMNIKTGAILAGGSVPYFDPNKVSDYNDQEKFNRLTLGVYELGSIFKIFSTAALLNEGAGMGRTFDARKPLKSGRHTIRDYHAKKKIMTVPEVFMHSSNIGSALMGKALGPEKLQSYYKKLGLLTKPEFCIGEMGKPLVPSTWRKINTLTASYGHGIAVSPLQLAAAVATSVGDGTYVHPHIVPQSIDNNTTERVFTKDTTHKMRQLLRLNAVQGTGKKALVTGYSIGGKTGTAEKPNPTGGYDRDKKISSFVSIFPSEDPQYLVLVLADEPIGHKGTYGYATGGWVAAPAAGKIVKHMVRILGISPEGDEEDMKFFSPLLKHVASNDKIARAN